MSEAVANQLLADVYRFLGRSLAYPDPAWLAAGHLVALAELLAELGWDEASRELQSLPAAPAVLLEALCIEHTRLFINAFPATVAPPYGSVHLPGGGMLNTAFTAKTRAFYRRYGFELANGADLADYLPLELEFLARLGEGGEEAAREEFLAECFRPWFGGFLARVRAGAELPFYRIVVELIDFFTKEEEEDGY
jgi:TorA maturation chaperone TorD